MNNEINLSEIIKNKFKNIDFAAKGVNITTK